MNQLTLVFIHGYSVSNLNTYGELPQRIIQESKSRGISISIENIFLGKYISFNDEVKLSDVAKALEAAIKKDLAGQTKFICITHSTGAPLIRTWLYLFYRHSNRCPMSHCIMLAPANHGSALAQLGKSRLSRIKCWLEGVEPGQNILNWLELGSDEAWELNINWIKNDAQELMNSGVFVFVLIGQDIDRKLYDHLNSYTGESGSDGVVRVSSANLNSRHILLQQSLSYQKTGSKENLSITEYNCSPTTAFRVLRKKSHSGDKMGILKSVKAVAGQDNSKETIESIFRCFLIKNISEYKLLCKEFEKETEEIQTESRLEVETKVVGQNYYFHDRYGMLIIKVTDSDANPVTDYDLVFTTGEEADPDVLPKGFLCDKQFNKLNKSTITFYYNFDTLPGLKQIQSDNETIRKAHQGISSIGIRLHARPDKGFIRFDPAEIKPSAGFLEKLCQPNSSTLLEIKLQRLVSTETFQFEMFTDNSQSFGDFKNTKEGENYII